MSRFETAVGKHIKAWRMARGLNQATLAERCGLDQPVMNALENGRRNVNAKLALALEMGTDIEAEEWLGLYWEEELQYARADALAETIDNEIADAGEAAA